MTMKQLPPLIFTLLALLSSLTLGAAERPNIILVMTDDQGYPCLGAHGHPWLQTPYLDQMHADSIRFESLHDGIYLCPQPCGTDDGESLHPKWGAIH